MLLPSSLFRGLLAALALAAVNCGHTAYSHGALKGSRILQVRVAGPSGKTPAAWNGDYYTWNQNSNNFPTYADPGFSYASVMPDGTIASAGINNGQNGKLNFAGLDMPSALWQQTPAKAGDPLELDFLATAPHDPSYFEVYLTLQSYLADSETLKWSNLEYLGRWSVGNNARPVTIHTGTSPVDGSQMKNSYLWQIPIPTDRSGHMVAVVIWQRQDPAGEAFVSLQDLNIAPVPEPASTVLLALGLAAATLYRRQKQHGC